jgi:hypothetical protein
MPLVSVTCWAAKPSGALTLRQRTKAAQAMPARRADVHQKREVMASADPGEGDEDVASPD